MSKFIQLVHLVVAILEAVVSADAAVSKNVDATIDAVRTAPGVTVDPADAGDVTGDATDVANDGISGDAFS